MYLNNWFWSWCIEGKTLNMQAQSVIGTPNSPSGERDYWLVFSVLSMLSLGTVMVFSATIAGDSKTLDLNYNHLYKHLFHILLGGLLMLLAASVKLEWLQKSSKVWLIFGLFALSALMFPGVGVEVNGSLRWINFGSLRVQPSEFVKLAAIIYFAHE